MELHQMLHQGEPEPEPRGCDRCSAETCVKGSKMLSSMCRGIPQPWSMTRSTPQVPASSSSREDCNVDATSRFTELGRVAEQIHQHLLEPDGIGVHVQGPRIDGDHELLATRLEGAPGSSRQRVG